MNPLRLSAIAFLIALPLLLSACGNKGPLILPPKSVPDVAMPPGAPAAQQVGDPSDSLDRTPQADDTSPASDVDDGDTDPPENADTNSDTP